MTPHSKAYLRFKEESERLTNFVALISHAVPVLRRVVETPGGAPVPIKPPDNFPHDRASGALLTTWMANYDQELARLIVLAIFSYFEAYVRAVVTELCEFQGGQQAFLGHSVKRATRDWTMRDTKLLLAKRRLQRRDEPGKADRFRKYTRVLEAGRFRFPSELLSAYGVRQLLRRIERDRRDGIQAWEIPDLLSDALLVPVTATQRKTYDALRTLRNKIAHGAVPPVTLHDAVRRTIWLRQWVTRLDEHITSHFFVLERYAE